MEYPNNLTRDRNRNQRLDKYWPGSSDSGHVPRRHVRGVVKEFDISWMRPDSDYIF